MSKTLTKSLKISFSEKERRRTKKIDINSDEFSYQYFKALVEDRLKCEVTLMTYLDSEKAECDFDEYSCLEDIVDGVIFVEKTEIVKNSPDEAEIIINEIAEVPTSQRDLDVSQWVCNHNKAFHRQSSDQDLAQFLYYVLNERNLSEHAIHPFWDFECLVEGQNWTVSFLNALEKSKIVVLLISEECLKGVENAHKVADNMFLEVTNWEIGLNMHKNRKIELYPVLIAKKRAVKVENESDTVFMDVEFRGFNRTFPDQHHIHNLSPKTQTIRQTMKEIFALQGIHVNTKSKSE
ncbi:hypothetical protein HK096_003083 [Nowakowskiella sp. JEL0078]|nr:hypothetical protein HK096_003083 [Nowakowskiella sp. JEL0078]